MKHLTSLFLGMVIGGTLAAHAEPRMWDTSGVFAREGFHLEYQSEVATNAQGQTITVWADSRFADHDIFAQVVDAQGNVLWDANGAPVVVAPGRQSRPCCVAATDGWIVAWADFRNSDGCTDIYAECAELWVQKLDQNGTPVWLDNDMTGVQVLIDEHPMYPPTLKMTSDAAGGAMLAWASWNGLGWRILVQHVTSAGDNWGWPVTIASLLHYGQHHFAVDTASGGDMLIAWPSDSSSWNPDIWVTRIAPSASMPWSDGIALCTNTSWQDQPAICSDGMNGCYVVWSDSRAGGASNLYAQYVNGAGQPQWTADGIPLVVSPGLEQQVSVAASFSGAAPDGLLFAWADKEASGQPWRVFGQHCSPAGTLRWDYGLLLSGDDVTRSNICPNITSDHAGGLYCTWMIIPVNGSEYGSGDVIATRALATGAYAWNADGVPVTASTHDLRAPRMIETGADPQVIFARWGVDTRTSLRVQQLNAADGGMMLPETGVELAGGMGGDGEVPNALALSGGRTVVFWQDNRTVSDWYQRYYYQLLDNNGVPLLVPNGLPLTPAVGETTLLHQYNLAVCTDGGGGCFAAYVDVRDSLCRIRISHINAAGEVVDDLAGRVVHDVQLSEYWMPSVEIIPDHAGGSYVSWYHQQPDMSVVVYVQRLSATLQPVWPNPVTFSPRPEYFAFPQEIEIADNGLFLLWTEASECADSYQYLTRLSADGEVNWSINVGDTLPGWTARMESDSAGGVFLLFDWWRGDSLRRDISAQRILADGSFFWGDSGHIVISAPQNQDLLAVAVDGNSRLYVAWQDEDSPSWYSMRMQFFTPDGEPYWQERGVLLRDDTYDVYEMKLLPDAWGGVYAVWAQQAIDAGETDHFEAAHLDEDGVFYNDPFWATGRFGWNNYELGWSLVPDGSGGCVVSWHQSEPHSSFGVPSTDIFAQRFWEPELSAREPRAAVPRRYALHQNYPNPFNSVTAIAFDLPQASNIELKVFDLLGREVAVLANRQLEAGHHTLPFDATPFASGIYFYRLHAGNFEQSRKLLLLK